MKGFLARYHQVLAFVASGAVLVAVGGTLTGIILVGRHNNPAVAGPTPTASFNPNAPTLSPSQSANPSGSASASPGLLAQSPPPGGALATPIGFGNGGAGCLGLANCTPAPRTTATAQPGPPVTATYAAPKSAAGGAPVSMATIDGSTIIFTDTGGNFETVSASSSAGIIPVNGITKPMGMYYDSVRHHLWVINAAISPGHPSVVEFDSGTFGAGATPIATYPLTSAAPAGEFQPTFTASPPIAIEGITVDTNGDVWFSEFSDASGNPVIGHIPASQVGHTATPEQCPLRRSDGHPMSIITGQDGHLYIGTTNGPAKWAQVSGASCLTSPGTYVETSAAGCGTNGQNWNVESLAIGPDGNTWFGTPVGVGEFSGNNPVMVACNTSGGLSGDHLAILTAPDPSQSGSKALWAAESGVPGVARIFGSTGTPITTSGSGADLRAMVKDSMGNLWIADAAHNQILEATPKHA